MHRAFLRTVLACLVLLPAVILGLALGARTLVVESLPVIDGRVRTAAVTGTVTIERDALGVPRIRAGLFLDACAAQGFVHAQDRYFQMDYLRRYASGRLSELVGPATVPVDIEMRTLGLSETADRALEALPERHRAMLRAYTGGVNAGLASLDARPPEYWAFERTPEPWRERDCILTAYTMAWFLEFGHRLERTRAGLHAALPPEVAEFLTPERGPFDALIDGSSPGDLPPIPAGLGASASSASASLREPVLPRGSNGFVVAGRRTGSGGAMLANDMHLGLDIPNTWYRVQLEWPAGEEPRRVVGVSLPGVPSIAVGSNGHIAWGFTNTTGDHGDFIVIEPDPADASRYRTPDGWEQYGQRAERIGVRGEAPRDIRIRTTRWGPVTESDPATGRPMVLRWFMMEPERFNLNLFDMVDARTAEEGARLAASWFGPSQNAMIADRHGAIAWTVTGAVPERIGFDGSVPCSWAEGSRGWGGVIDDADRPMVLDPVSGALVTANNRTLPPKRARALGTHWSNGSRAGRIMQLLGDRAGLTERDLLAIQLDTRSPVHAEYARHLRELVPEMRGRVPEDWDARADIDSTTFTIVHAWAESMADRLLAPAVEVTRARDPSFRYRWMMDDDWLIRLLRERPDSWLPPGVESWSELALDAAPRSLDLRWGDVNRANIYHRFSPMLPARLAAALDMPHDPLPGARLAVRVQTPGFGASQRLVVTPGREEVAIFHMPAGQSAHFLSPFYRAGHGAWVRGEPTGLLAGAPEHTLVLEPSPGMDE